MNMRKSRLVWMFCVLLILPLVTVSAFAQDKATPKEVVQKVKEAVKLIQDKGADAAFQAIGDKGGAFVWKDSYVVVTDTSGKMLVHPVNAKLVGTNVKGIKDANGKLFQAEMDNVAASQGGGWVDFMWVKPGEKTPTPKVSFVMAVPGTELICNAGVYNFTKQEAEQAGK
jgi:cytochrome c